jgi:hypothetical protein
VIAAGQDMDNFRFAMMGGIKKLFFAQVLRWKKCAFREGKDIKLNENSKIIFEYFRPFFANSDFQELISQNNKGIYKKCYSIGN